MTCVSGFASWLSSSAPWERELCTTVTEHDARHCLLALVEIRFRSTPFRRCGECWILGHNKSTDCSLERSKVISKQRLAKPSETFWERWCLQILALSGLPSLKALASSWLDQPLHQGAHSSVEDARLGLGWLGGVWGGIARQQSCCLADHKWVALDSW